MIVQRQRFFDERFFDDDRFFDEELFLDEERFFELFLLGTFPPYSLASDRPIAMACLRLVTFLPERPLLCVPFFFRCNALFTRFCELFP